MIKYEENCFNIIEYEQNKIIFDISEINPDKEFGTCLDFGKSIFYNSYECISKPAHTFFVLNNEENTGVIKNCNIACNTCEGEGDEYDTNCIDCSLGYFKTEDSETNCILEELIPENYHKNEEDGIYYKDQQNPDDINNKQCENNLYLSLTGECLSNCPSGSYKFILAHKCVELCPNNYHINLEQDECILNEKNQESENQEMYNFYSDINLNVNLDLNITNINLYNTSEEKNNEELISKFIASNLTLSSIIKNNYIQIIIKTDKMNINEQIQNGYSAVDIGNCSEVLKEQYNIPNEQDLIILNMELNDKINKNNTDSSNIFGKFNLIEVYDFSARKLNLSYCVSEIKIMKYIGDIIEDLNIEKAKDLAEWGIDIYNANNEFFNDLCYEFESSDGMDITIEDRRNDIYQNITFCQDGCSYGGIDYDLMIVNCICNTNSLQNDSQNKMNNDKENFNQFKELVKSFIANWLDFNIDVIYCYNLVFNGRIIKSNIGFFFMGSMFALQIIILSIFLIKKLKPIKTYMINSLKKNIKISQNNPPKMYRDKDEKNGHNNIKKNKNRGGVLNNTLIFQTELPKHSLKNKYNKNNQIKKNNFVPIIYKSKNDLINYNLSQNKGMINSKEKINNLEAMSYNIKLSEKSNSIEVNENNTNNNNEKRKNNKYYITNLKISQKDEDLQDMDFQEAINEDKRSFLRIYWCFLVDSQTILGTFLTENYLDLLIIKISFLLCNFQISFFLNALFYTDEYISDAYHNESILEFFTGLPKSIYSFVATLITTNLLRMLSSSKSELIQIIREKKKHKDYMNLINSKIKKLRIKLIIYFILIFSLGLFFFYYVSSFCSVYRNSQKYWFIGCLESFLIDLLVTVIICILLAIFRYLAIMYKIKCLYIVVTIIKKFL